MGEEGPWSLVEAQSRIGSWISRVSERLTAIHDHSSSKGVGTI